MNKNFVYLFFLIPSILLFSAPLISFPYGFYTMLRIIVTLTSAIIIYQSYKKSNIFNEYAIIFSLIMILYNPFIPVYLSREIWLPINFVTSGIYLYALFKSKKFLNL